MGKKCTWRIRLYRKCVTGLRNMSSLPVALANIFVNIANRTIASIMSNEKTQMK